MDPYPGGGGASAGLAPPRGTGGSGGTPPGVSVELPELLERIRRKISEVTAVRSATIAACKSGVMIRTVGRNLR